MSAIFIDAAMGSRLADLGHELEAPLWSASILHSDPDAVARVHRENIDAGAQVITTNTFRTTPYAFHQAGFNGVEAHAKARALTLLALRIAWKTVKESGQDVQIAAGIAPLADCYKPKDYPGNISARPWHDAQMDNLDHQATDIFLIETMNSAREARLLTELALGRQKPVWVSFILNGNGNILNGDDLISTAIELERAGVSAIGANCSSLRACNIAVKALREAVDLPILVYPNLGYSERESGDIKNRMSPEEFAEWTIKAEELGASIIGACCGSSHEHLLAACALEVAE